MNGIEFSSASWRKDVPHPAVFNLRIALRILFRSWLYVRQRRAAPKEMRKMDPTKWPALVSYVVNMVVAAVVAFGFIPRTTADYIVTLVVAATSLVAAFFIRPVPLGVATGAFQTLLVGVAAFGFHHALNDEQVASAVAIFGLIATVVMHYTGTPTVAARQGTTVEAMERARHQAEVPMAVR